MSERSRKASGVVGMGFPPLTAQFYFCSARISYQPHLLIAKCYLLCYLIFIANAFKVMHRVIFTVFSLLEACKSGFFLLRHFLPGFGAIEILSKYKY